MQPTEKRISTRVKSCSHCRHQKLRCDAQKDYSKACSRCRRLNLRCVVQRVLNDNKPEVTSSPEELSSLKQYVTPTEQNAASNSVSTVASGRQLQTLPSQEFDRLQLEECYSLFLEHYAPQTFLIGLAYDRPTCLATSPLLYWTIVTIGSRKYPTDPSLLGRLIPQLNELVHRAVFASDMPTIQSYMLLCNWPMPVDTLSKETTTLLSALMLQSSINKGLHIRGIGQDFSRMTLYPDQGLELSRAKLWISCLITSQRINCAYGLPSPALSDSYEKNQVPLYFENELPADLLYERNLSLILVGALMDLGKATHDNGTGSVRQLSSLVRIHDSQLVQLSQRGMSIYGRVHLLCAQLQVQSFLIFLGQENAEHSMLGDLFAVACTAVETMLELDDQIGFTQCVGDYITKMLHLAASVIVRLSRSIMKGLLDLGRGEAAYFSAINLFRDMAVQSDDVMARSTVILSQLWTSQTLFDQPDGNVDSFSLQCRSRLAMSSVYDMWWRWRTEFAHQPHPYTSPNFDQATEPNCPQPLVNYAPFAQNGSTQSGLQGSIQDPGLTYDWNSIFDMPMELWDTLKPSVDDPNTART